MGEAKIMDMPIKEIETAKVKETVQPITKHEAWFVLLMTAIVFFGIRLLVNEVSGVSVPIMLILTTAAVYGYARMQRLSIPRANYYYMGFNILLSGSFAIYDNLLASLMNVLVLMISFSYWLLVLLSARKNNRLDHHVVIDLALGLLLTPLENLGNTLTKFRGLGKDHKAIKQILLGVLISLPALAFVLVLLSSADATFSNLVDVISNAISSQFISNVFSLIVAVPIALGFFNVIYQNQQVKMKNVQALEIKPIISTTVGMTVLSMFGFVYLVFFGTTISGYMAFAREAFTPHAVSEYAREGFFQLVAVSLINVGIFFMVKLFSKNTPAIKIGLTVIGLETIGLIIVGFAKMQLYISAFGLTILRFGTSIFMMLLTVCVIFFAAALWHNFNYVKWTIVVVALTLLGLSYTNSGNLIASYNYQRFEAGKIEKLDTSMFYDLGVQAVPTALKIYQSTNDPKIKHDVKEYLNETRSDLYQPGHYLNLEHHRMKQLLAHKLS